MKLNTTRLLVASFLLMPSMLLAKPATKKKGKKKAKPAAAAPATPVEEGAAEASPSAPAAAEGETASYQTAYGMAGCGLGALVIKKDDFMQIFAATLNGTGVQTFGITSGTSQCKPSSKAMAQEQKVFIEANLVSLKREAASGNGETLTAFADLLGCQAEEFSQVSKSNFQQIYSAPEADSILQGYKAVLASQCSRLI